MRRVVAGVVIASAIGVIAGCSGTISQGSATTPTKPSTSTSPRTTSPSSSVGVIFGQSLSPKQICLGSFKSAVLLEWAPATVVVFRKYQYGSKPTVPLANVFASMLGSARGAWCGTKAGREATHWWAVMVGQKPASLMIMNGGIEGVRHGLVSRPPQVP